MKDLSYHILDIVQNSLHAGADRIEIRVVEKAETGKLTLTISDNGCGMPPEIVEQVTEPFYTTSVTKKVGLGLPLLKQNAEQTGGMFSVESVENKGTIVTATFNHAHIDMIPLGDVAATMKVLISSSPEKDFIYGHKTTDGQFEMNTAEIRAELDGLSLNTREVIEYIVEFIHSNMKAIKVETNGY